MALNKDYLEIGYDIIGCAYEVRNTSGRLLREKYYRDSLTWELRQRGYEVENEVLVPALYKGVEIGEAYKADIVVDNRVVVETKAIVNLGEKEVRQLITYLKLSDFKLGYLINFGTRTFRNGKLTDPFPYDKGIYRLVNNL